MSLSVLIWHLGYHRSDFVLQRSLNTQGIFFTLVLPMAIPAQVQSSLFESDARKER